VKRRVEKWGGAMPRQDAPSGAWRHSTNVVCLLVVLTGCGYIGPVQAPALNIPIPVVDLRAAEYGDRIIADFTVPDQTVDGLKLKTVQSVELGVGPIPKSFSIENWAAGAKKLPVPGVDIGSRSFDFAAQEWIGKEILIAVRTGGPKGKMSAWSNTATFTVEQPLESPANVKAEADPRGVLVTWRGSGPRYRLFRAAGDGEPARLGNDTDQPTFLDESAEFGTRYRYLVQAVASETRLSVTAEAPAVTPKDIFPPAVPSGLGAVPGVNTVELAWERNTESDFKGYNVYRATGDGAFEKIASEIEAPTFSDNKVESGKRYRYAVSAVDLSGNESARSVVIEAILP